MKTAQPHRLNAIVPLGAKDIKNASLKTNVSVFVL